VVCYVLRSRAVYVWRMVLSVDVCSELLERVYVRAYVEHGARTGSR
jgi:hypothetical protein